MRDLEIRAYAFQVCETFKVMMQKGEEETGDGLEECVSFYLHIDGTPYWVKTVLYTSSVWKGLFEKELDWNNRVEVEVLLRDFIKRYFEEAKRLYFACLEGDDSVVAIVSLQEKEEGQ